jgi:hypothetical protein
MYEPWVMNIDLSSIPTTPSSLSDPDHPTVEKLSKTSTKQQRTGIAMITLIQSIKECPRKFFANYLGDTTPDGELPFSIPND